MPAKFSPLSFWRVARDHGVTWYSAVPTLHQLLLARAPNPASRRPAGAERLRFIRSCSASLPPRLMHALEAAFGAPVVEAYGMTEAAHQMASNPLPPAERKPGSVGCGTDVRISIMDKAGRASAAGRTRRGRHPGSERHSRLREQSRGERDVVRRRMVPHRRPGLPGRRRLSVAGRRIKELINRGGEKISPREIDEVLLAHPAVAEAVCFGVPHATWGEEVAAAVVLREAATEAELLAYCREHLADYKRPKQIHITETIPRTATGKIQRGVVAKAVQAEGVVRIVIAGAGAIGGYIGARLARAGARRRAVRPRPASARDAGARPSRRSARTAISR